MKQKKLTIGWLYPKQMSTYGDRGNILTLWQRCRWRGIAVGVEEIDLGEKIHPTKIDLYFFGGGQDQAQEKISNDLEKTKKEAIRKAVRLGSVFLGICGGYQLFGKYYQPSDREKLPGLGILDIQTKAGGERMIGNCVVEVNQKILPGIGKYLVGFENHSGKTFLDKKAKSFGRVVVGSGNNGEDRSEGAVQGNVFGCYLHGPVLPKNPKFADFLIRKALQRKYSEIELQPLDDKAETNTHESAIERSKEVK